MIRDLKTPPFQFRETKIFIFNFFFLTSNSNYLFSSLLSLLSQTEIFTKTLEFKFLANNISMLFFDIKIIFRFANLYLTDIFSLKCLDFYLTCHMIRLIIITWPLPLSLSFFLSVSTMSFSEVWSPSTNDLWIPRIKILHFVFFKSVYDLYDCTNEYRL